MNNPDENFKNLIILFSHLKNNKPLTIELNNWLIHAFDNLAAGRSKTLDEALNINSQSGRSHIGPRLNRHIRDQLLINLVEVSGSRNDSAWKRSQAASKTLKKFHKRKKIILKKLPDNTTQIEKLTLQIFNLYPDTPTSAYTLYDLVRTYHVNYKKISLIN